MAQSFPSNNAYLLTELQYLDFLIRGEVEQVRRSDDEALNKAFTGAYVSENEVDQMLSAPPLPMTPSPCGENKPPLCGARSTREYCAA